MHHATRFWQLHSICFQSEWTVRCLNIWSREWRLKHGWPLLFYSSFGWVLRGNKLFCCTRYHTKKLLVLPQQPVSVTCVLNHSVFEALWGCLLVYMHLSVRVLVCVWSRLFSRPCLWLTGAPRMTLILWLAENNGEDRSLGRVCVGGC